MRDLEAPAGVSAAHRRTAALTQQALGAALICLCSWITLPGAVPFTMQTFAVACVLGLLGGRRGTAAILCYLALGAAGLPVFAGFTGGPGRLFGATGGYLVGFLAMGLVYWLVTGRSARPWRMAAGWAAGLVVCYLFGTVWFVCLYGGGPISFAAALGTCVLPFLPADAAKLALAGTVVRLIAPRLHLADRSEKSRNKGEKKCS